MASEMPLKPEAVARIDLRIIEGHPAWDSLDEDEWAIVRYAYCLGYNDRHLDRGALYKETSTVPSPKPVGKETRGQAAA